MPGRSTGLRLEGSENKVEQEGQARDQAVRWFGRWFAEEKGV